MGLFDDLPAASGQAGGVFADLPQVRQPSEPKPAELAEAFRSGQLSNPTPAQIDAIRAHERNTPIDWSAIPGQVASGLGDVAASAAKEYLEASLDPKAKPHPTDIPVGPRMAPGWLPSGRAVTAAARVVPSAVEAPVRASVGLLSPVVRGVAGNAQAAGALAAPTAPVWPAVKAAAGEAVDQAKQGNLLNALGAATTGFLPAVARGAAPEADRNLWLARQRDQQQVEQGLEQAVVPGALPRVADALSYVAPGVGGATLQVARAGTQASKLAAGSLLARRLAAVGARLDAATEQVHALTAAGPSAALDTAREGHRRLQQQFLDLVDRWDKANPEGVPDDLAKAGQRFAEGVAKEAGEVGGAVRGATGRAGGAARAVGELGERATAPAAEALGRASDLFHGKGGMLGALGLASLVPHQITGALGGVMGAVAAVRFGSKLTTHYGAALNALARADWRSSVRVWEQLAKDADAPVWLKLAAKSPAGGAVEGAVREGAALAKGTAEGTALGAGLSVADPEASPESRGTAVGFGAGLGAAGTAAARVVGRGRLNAARLGHDMAVKAHETIQAGQDPVAVMTANPTALLYGTHLEHLLKGAMPGGADLKVAFLDKPHFEAEMRRRNNAESTAVAFFDRESNTAYLDLSNHDADARALHEALGHGVFESAVSSRPEIVQQLSEALTRNGSSTQEAERQYAQALYPKASDAELQTYIATERQRATEQYQNPDAWVAGELLADASVRALGGRDIAALASPSPLRRRMAEDVGGFRSSFFAGNVLKAIDDPAVRQFAEQGLRRLGEYVPGVDAPVEQAVSVGPGTWGKHPGAQIRPDAPGGPGNDFFRQSPDGSLAPRPPAEVRRIIVSRRREMDATVPLSGKPAEANDADPVVKLRRTRSGVERSGTEMPAGYYGARSVGAHTKQAAKALQTAIQVGGTMSGWYQAVGHGPEWKAHVARHTGTIEAQHYDFVPYGFHIDKQGNALVRAYSINAFERKASEWATRPGGKLSLELWGGDVGAFRADVQTYLRNHAAGRPGADGLGDAKRDVIDVFLIGRGAVAEIDRNPLRAHITGNDRQGIIRSFRLDRFETVEPSEVKGFSKPDYGKQLLNFSPSTSAPPEAAQAAIRAATERVRRLGEGIWKTAIPTERLRPGDVVAYDAAPSTADLQAFLVGEVRPDETEPGRSVVHLVAEDGRWADLVVGDTTRAFYRVSSTDMGFRAGTPAAGPALGYQRPVLPPETEAAKPPPPSTPYPAYAEWPHAERDPKKLAAMDRDAAEAASLRDAERAINPPLPRTELFSPSVTQDEIRPYFDQVVRRGPVIVGKGPKAGEEARGTATRPEPDPKMLGGSQFRQRKLLERAVPGARPDGGVGPATGGALFSPGTFSEWEKALRASSAAQKILGREGIDRIVRDSAHARDLLLSQAGMLPPEQAPATKFPANADKLFIDTWDLNTTCVQQEHYLAAIDHIEHSLAGRVLNPVERYAVGLLLQDAGLSTSCWYCYVQGPRDVKDHASATLADIIAKVKASGTRPTPKSLEKVFPEGWKTDGAFGMWLRKNWGNLPDISGLDLRDMLRGRVPTPEPLKGLTEVAEITVQAIAKENSAKGWMPYLDQILRMSDEDIAAKNSRAGQRMNSSTEFTPWHVLDIAQGLTHAQLRGLMMHVYTKQPDFIDIFGNTGIRFNMSVEYGHDAQGNLMPREGSPGSFIFNSMEGMPDADALRLQQAYGNAGCMLMAMNEVDLLAGMADPNVHMIIPYHSGKVSKQVEAHVRAENFTSQQHEHWPEQWPTDARGKYADQSFTLADGSTVTLNPDRAITRREHRDNKERYLEVCAAAGITPRFAKYVDNPGYMKMVRDVARTDTPQAAIDVSSINWDAAGEVVTRWQSKGGRVQTASPQLQRYLNKAFGAAGQDSSLFDAKLREIGATYVARREEAARTGGERIQLLTEERKTATPERRAEIVKEISGIRRKLATQPKLYPTDPVPVAKPSVDAKEGASYSPRTMVIYRAAQKGETGIRPWSSWTTEESTAKAYQDNPGYGGPVIREETVPEGKVLDVDPGNRRGMRQLARELGMAPEDGDTWVDNGWRYPWEESKKIADALEASEYDWIRYPDDYPPGATTLVPIRRVGSLKSVSSTAAATAPSGLSNERLRELGTQGACGLLARAAVQRLGATPMLRYGEDGRATHAAAKLPDGSVLNLGSDEGLVEVSRAELLRACREDFDPSRLNIRPGELKEALDRLQVTSAR